MVACLCVFFVFLFCFCFCFVVFFFFQAEDGIRDVAVTGVQTCALPICMVQSLNVSVAAATVMYEAQRQRQAAGMYETQSLDEEECQDMLFKGGFPFLFKEIGRASCRERG